MKFSPQTFENVYLIEPEPKMDSRGMFRRHYCQEDFLAHDINFQILQTNFSENTSRFTLRGIHYRNELYPESKMLTCVRGSIYCVIVDLRSHSSTYLNWMSFELNETNRTAIFLPHGIANGFLTLSDNTIIHYYHSSIYKEGADTGVRYDDPLLQINWPAKPLVISEKDLSFAPLQPLSGRVGVP